MRRPVRVRAVVAPVALVLAAVGCTAVARESRSATVVLFDASNSTRTDAVRARYERTFDLVLANLRDDGGALGVDVIDDAPLAHGELPVSDTFQPCTILDNSLDCRQTLESTSAEARHAVRAIWERHALGTDVFGALSLAEQFFAAYPGWNPRTLVICSDMVQFANGLRFPAVRDWSQPAIRDLLSRAPAVDLAGVQVYVVGAGATSGGRLTAERIEGIERFWRAWFEAMGANVVFYGANLPRFPIP